MKEKIKTRETVLRSLSAVGALREAEFYVDLFRAQPPEQFALIVLDPRCLTNPLMEALISNIRILSDLGLFPTIFIGAGDQDMTKVRFQSQRLMRELESASVRTSKLNAASYGLIPEIKSKISYGRVPILELTHRAENVGLVPIARELKPAKIIFLQPSGGLSREGNRVPVVDIDNVAAYVDPETLSPGQTEFLTIIKDISQHLEFKTVYVMASPLNLLGELFTVKGSGTLLRPAAKIEVFDDVKAVDQDRMQESIETAFGRKLLPEFWLNSMRAVYLDHQYRGGAIVTHHSKMPYLSKFWVVRAARGEGLARDIWDKLCQNEPKFFWRSRRENPFNDWYMQSCDGMQMQGEWRVFWRGLETKEIAGAVGAATASAEDFLPGQK